MLTNVTIYPIYSYNFPNNQKLVILYGDYILRLKYITNNFIRFNISRDDSKNYNFFGIKDLNEFVSASEDNFCTCIKQQYPELDTKYVKEFFDFDFTKSIDIKNILGEYEYNYFNRYNIGMLDISKKISNESILKKTNIFYIQYDFSKKTYTVFNYYTVPQVFDTIDEVYEYIKIVYNDNIISKEELERFENRLLIWKLRGDI